MSQYSMNTVFNTHLPASEFIHDNRISVVINVLDGSPQLLLFFWNTEFDPRPSFELIQLEGDIVRFHGIHGYHDLESVKIILLTYKNDTYLSVQATFHVCQAIVSLVNRQDDSS